MMIANMPGMLMIYTSNTTLIEIEIDEANKKMKMIMLCLRKKYDEDASNIRRNSIKTI